MNDIFAKDAEYLAHAYARYPLEIVRGRGSVALGADGKEYIDLGSGIAVNTFGWSDPEWLRAVESQLEKFQHTSNLYYTAPCVTLAGMLCRRTGMRRVFFSNSGAEANECAIKAARKYAAEKKGAAFRTVVTLRNSFHGRTITTLAATGQEAFHRDYLPLTEGFVAADANDLADVEKKVRENGTAAVLFEVVQGEGGVVPLAQDYVKGLARLAAENDVLLIADEVQIGNGRSGRLYGYMNYGIRPDIVTTAKGLGGGLPLGATLLGEKVKDVFTPGSHGSTFGGNPVCCAGAVNVLGCLDDKLLAEVRAKSGAVRRELTGAEGIRNVTGLGLMLGFEPERPAGQIVEECLRRGVLLLTAKTKVRLLPALNIPASLLSRAVQVIKEVCAGR